MNNWEIDEDLLWEERRLDELERIEAFFLDYYGIPKHFRAWTNYKTGDKYVIELSNIDKNVNMKVEINRKLYDIVNTFVTTHAKKDDEYIQIRQELDRNGGE